MERLGWAMLILGAILFYLAWVGVVFAAYLYSTKLAEGVLQLCVWNP